jgi:hypothetical protein
VASPQAGLIAGHIRPTDCVVRLQDGLKWRLTRPGPHGLAGELARLPNGRVTDPRLAPTRGPPAGELVGGGSLGGSPGGTQPGSLVGRAVSIVRSRCTISKHILVEITRPWGTPTASVEHWGPPRGGHAGLAAGPRLLVPRWTTDPGGGERSGAWAKPRLASSRGAGTRHTRISGRLSLRQDPLLGLHRLRRLRPDVVASRVAPRGSGGAPAGC